MKNNIVKEVEKRLSAFETYMKEESRDPTKKFSEVSLVQEALKQLESGELEQAITKLSQALHYCHGGAQLGLGDYFFSHKKYEAALKAYEHGLKKESHCEIILLYALAHCCLEGNLVEQGITAVKKQAEKPPASPGNKLYRNLCLSLLGYIHSETGDQEEAEKQYNTVSEAYLDDHTHITEWQDHFGDWALEKKRINEARIHYKIAIALGNEEAKQKLAGLETSENE